MFIDNSQKLTDPIPVLVYLYRNGKITSPSVTNRCLTLCMKLSFPTFLSTSIPRNVLFLTVRTLFNPPTTRFVPSTVHVVLRFTNLSIVQEREVGIQGPREMKYLYRFTFRMKYREDILGKQYRIESPDTGRGDEDLGVGCNNVRGLPSIFVE